MSIRVRVTILILSAILVGACSSNSKPKPQKIKKENISKPKPTPVKTSGISLNELKPNGFTSLALKGPKEYKSGEPVRFIIDTKNKDGYLYVIYEDSKGEVGVLYPNPNVPLSEISGKYIFPDNFGIDPKSITASKDCGNCKKDKTVIYALLTKEPILNIRSINKTTLHNILGLDSSKSKTKGLKVDFSVGANSNSGNVNVGVFEFYVK